MVKGSGKRGKTGAQRYVAVKVRMKSEVARDLQVGTAAVPEIPRKGSRAGMEDFTESKLPFTMHEVHAIPLHCDGPDWDPKGTYWTRRDYVLATEALSEGLILSFPVPAERAAQAACRIAQGMEIEVCALFHPECSRLVFWNPNYEADDDDECRRP